VRCLRVCHVPHGIGALVLLLPLGRYRHGSLFIHHRITSLRFFILLRPAGIAQLGERQLVPLQLLLWGRRGEACTLWRPLIREGSRGCMCMPQERRQD